MIPLHSSRVISNVVGHILCKPNLRKLYKSQAQLIGLSNHTGQLDGIILRSRHAGNSIKLLFQKRNLFLKIICTKIDHKIFQKMFDSLNVRQPFYFSCLKCQTVFVLEFASVADLFIEQEKIKIFC